MSGASPIAEEAGRLVEAASEWLRSRAEAGATFAAEHVATGSPECQLCPVCQGIALLKGARPEVVDHLSSAASSLLLALRGFVEAHEQHWAQRPRGPVEHIDIG